MPFSITITGVDALLAALDDYRFHRDYEFEIACEEGLALLSRKAAEYPAVPAGSQYIRTMTLKMGWLDSVSSNYQSTADGFHMSIENDTPYGPYVQGGPEDDPHQAQIHFAYWDTLDRIIADNEDDVTRIFEEATARLVKALES